MGPPLESPGERPSPLLDATDAGDGVLVVRCRAHSLMELAVVEAFSVELRALADRLDPGTGVVFNLAGIELLASNALLSLLLFQRRVTEDRAGAFETCEPDPWVAELFRVAGGSRWAPHPSEAGAIEAVRRTLQARRGSAPRTGPGRSS